MRDFPEDSRVELVWTRTRAFPDAWELRMGSELVGTLRWLRMFRSDAEGETSQARWILRSAGFLSRRTEVLDASTQAPVAVFQRRFGGKGEVTLPDGRRVLWTYEGWFPRIPLFATTDGFPIMRFPIAFGLFERDKKLEIDETARGMRELPLLALLGRYLIVLCRRRRRH